MDRVDANPCSALKPALLALSRVSALDPFSPAEHEPGCPGRATRHWDQPGDGAQASSNGGGDRQSVADVAAASPSVAGGDDAIGDRPFRANQERASAVADAPAAAPPAALPKTRMLKRAALLYLPPAMPKAASSAWRRSSVARRFKSTRIGVPELRQPVEGQSTLHANGAVGPGGE
jgi:hypothetical protein